MFQRLRVEAPPESQELSLESAGQTDGRNCAKSQHSGENSLISLDKFTNPCMVSCMATKTISLELDAYEKLRRSKLEGESFSAVVRRARFDPADARGSTIISALAALPVRESDKKAVIHWEKTGLPARTTSPSAWEGERES